jgi:4-hydroxybenzoate polyprenyltransferase
MRRIDLALGISVLVFLAGIVRDLQWHATHDTQREFETASKQVEVHAILWLGALAILVVSALALKRAQTRSTPGYRITFISAVAYAGISIWHFIEHANGNDPELAHLFLYASSLAIVSGAFLVLRRAVDDRRSLAQG